MRRWLSLLAIAAAVVLGAIGHPTRKRTFVRRLTRPTCRSVQVEVEDDSSIVHLKGIVDTTGDRTRAEEVASAAVGTSGAGSTGPP